MVIRGMDRVSISVSNLEESLAFYRDWIGMEVVAEQILEPDKIQQLWNLPEGLVDDVLTIPPGTEVKIAFFNKENALLVEILQFSVKGKSLASVARPPNLGLFMISFEVNALFSLMETCKKEGISILSGPVDLHTKVHGKMRAITVEGPSGAMIELFER